MKKVFSIIAVIGAAGYVAAGIGILLFQEVLKKLLTSGENITVYPLQNVLHLVLVGIPCLILGIASLSEHTGAKRGMNLLLVIYTGIMLVSSDWMIWAGTLINNMFVARMQGAAVLANTSMVNSFFNGIQFLIKLSLVMLLIRGTVSLGGKNQNK